MMIMDFLWKRAQNNNRRQVATQRHSAARIRDLRPPDESERAQRTSVPVWIFDNFTHSHCHGQRRMGTALSETIEEGWIIIIVIVTKLITIGQVRSAAWMSHTFLAYFGLAVCKQQRLFARRPTRQSTLIRPIITRQMNLSPPKWSGCAWMQRTLSFPIRDGRDSKPSPNKFNCGRPRGALPDKKITTPKKRNQFWKWRKTEGICWWGS